MRNEVLSDAEAQLIYIIRTSKNFTVTIHKVLRAENTGRRSVAAVLAKPPRAQAYRTARTRLRPAQVG